jgi:hypothetical protein
MIRDRSIVYRAPVALIGLLLAISLICLSGCGVFSRPARETKQLYKGLDGSTGVYKKIMVLLPFGNDVRWLSTDLDTSFGPELREAVRAKCGQIEVLLPEDPNFPSRFNQTPRTAEGDPDGTELAAIGRATGINMVLSGRLVSIRHTTEDRGMLWFAEVAHLARIHMEVAVYHTGTGAKLLDKTVFQDIDISASEGALIEAGEMPGAVSLSETLTDAAENMGKAVCDVLGRIPWEGYVIGVEDNRIVLSAGEASGLKKGKTLRVYTAQEAAGQEGGTSFIAPGKPLGSITVTAVHADHSEAMLKDGGPVVPGSLVRAR